MSYLIVTKNEIGDFNKVLTKNKTLLVVVNSEISECLKRAKVFIDKEDAVTMLESADILINFNAVDFYIIECPTNFITSDKKIDFLNIVHTQTSKETKRIAEKIAKSFND